MIFDNPIPITKEVSVHPLLISSLSVYAFPNPFDFFQIVDKVTDEAIEEVYDDTKSYTENQEVITIRCQQKLWNLILEKGRDNNV